MDDSPSAPDNPPPRSGARTLASLLLAVHCLCVAFALSASFAPSPLQRRLKVVLAPYLSTLHLDPMPATFHWTHGDQLDAGHQIEVLAAGEDGLQWRPISDTLSGTPARLRQLQAARELARLVELEAEEDVARLARDAARWAVARDLRPQRIRLRRQHLQRPEDVAGASVPRRSPLDPSYFETLYEADLLVDPEDPTKLGLVKRTAPAEAAQVVGGGAEGNSPTTSAGGTP